MRNLKQHVPGQYTDGNPDAISCRNSITVHVCGKGTCGT